MAEWFRVLDLAHTSCHLMQDILNFTVIHDTLQEVLHVHAIGVLSSLISL